jgi:uncharacterized protein (TIGR01244 family)
MIRPKELSMRVCLSVLAALTLAGPALAQQVTQENVPGIDNFKRLETTIACAGATSAQSVPELKKMGYASIINLRLPTENGANIDEEAAAAKQADIKFIHIPFNGQSPDPAAADKFLDVITTPANNPALIQCASANRAAMMWMIKRLVVDHWDADKAGDEAKQLGLTSGALREFAVNYASSHKR